MEQIFENDFDLDELREHFAIVREQVDLRAMPSEGEIDEDAFFAVLNEIIEAAEEGDVVAQDYIAYLYKRGYHKVIPPSIKTYLRWSIMAGANGNKYSIEKLKIFLTPAINSVCNEPDFEEIVKRNDLYLETYEYVIARLFCQAIVDHMQLDIKDLVKGLNTTTAENEEIEMRVFDKARNEVFPKVMEFLRN